MPLKKLRKQKLSREGDGEGNGFSQARLDRIRDSMQPLMTKHASEDELERIFRDVDDYVASGKGGSGFLKLWGTRCLSYLKRVNQGL